MTDRDEFAKTALIGFISSLPGGTYDLDLVAKQAYEIADAMLRQREKCQVLSQENLTLTDAEREAIEWSINDQIDGGHQNHPAVKEVIVTLRGLLKRLGGEK